jgi:hypothetical protein
MRPEERDPRVGRIVLKEFSDLRGANRRRPATPKYIVGYISTDTNEDGEWGKTSLKVEHGRIHFCKAERSC